MKKINLLYPICCCTLLLIFAGTAPAEENETKEGVQLYPGMEIKKVGDVNVLIPKGSKLRHENDLLVIESTDEYAAPRFIEMDKRLTKLEAGQQELKAEVKELKTTIQNLNSDKKDTSPPENPAEEEE